MTTPEAEYLLCLGLLAMVWSAPNDYRVGCTLVPAGQSQTFVVSGPNAEEVDVAIDQEQLITHIRELLSGFGAAGECRVTAESFANYIGGRKDRAAAKKAKGKAKKAGA